MNKKQITITIGVMCLILTLAISIQIKTIKNTSSTISQTLTDDSLRDEVLMWKERYDDVYEQLSNSEKELTKIRETATQDNTEYTDKEEQIRKNNQILGLTDVTGSGVVITLRDNSNVTADSLSVLDSIDYYLVHDMDLRTIVNELKNAGAEAISVNEQRIVQTTSITCEGVIVQVNGETVGSPFTIKAIGSPELLYGSLTRPGGYIEALKNTGVIVDVKKTEKIDISKFAGVINAKYMKNS